MQLKNPFFWQSLFVMQGTAVVVGEAVAAVEVAFVLVGATAAAAIDTKPNTTILNILDVLKGKQFHC
jgi:hypothetical protein